MIYPLDDSTSARGDIAQSKESTQTAPQDSETSSECLNRQSPASSVREKSIGTGKGISGAMLGVQPWAARGSDKDGSVSGDESAVGPFLALARQSREQAAAQRQHLAPLHLQGGAARLAQRS